MENLLIYLAKSTALALLFMASYWFLLRKDTFFKANRIYLLGGLLLSFVLPVITFTKTVWVNPQPITINTGAYQIVEVAQTNPADEFSWIPVLVLLYSIGFIIFGLRLALQLVKIQQLKNKSVLVKDDDIIHVQATTQLSPFSFFRNIFYYPKQFSKEELDAIIAHEKIHVHQYHSLDVLFTQILAVVFWFNPLVWVYQSLIKQNLEYLADANALQNLENKKEYQYLMLQQAVGYQNIGITNSFYNSLIKNRIQMLHQHPSKKRNRLKLLLILPVLATFLVAFNVETEFKVLPNETVSIIEQDFSAVITKSSSQSDLESIKEQLNKLDIDFSFLTVRNEKKLIIDLELEATLKNSQGTNSNSKFKTDSGQPIKDVLLKYDPSLKVLIMKPLKSNSFIKQQESTQEATKPNTTTSKVQITNVTLEIDKDTKTENLKKDSEFLAERGVTVKFKGIKRNNLGEITAIKVTTDNGAGAKETHQQKKTQPISPIKVVVDFAEDKAPSVTILSNKQQEAKTMVWISNDEPKVEEIIEIRKEEKPATIIIGDRKSTTKVIQIDKSGENEIIMIDGKRISSDDFSKEGKIEKLMMNIIERADTINGKVTVENITLKKDNGYEQIIIRDKENSEDKKYKYIVFEKDSVVTVNNILSDDTIIDLKGAKDKIILRKEDDGKLTVSKDIMVIRHNNEKPLYIIDGKESATLTVTNPEDIESIEILKGEAAIKKYGDKAKNGVVEITTKK